MKKLRVCFYPAIDAERPLARYEEEFKYLKEAVIALDSIATYTLMLHETSLMPDYSNSGFIEMLDDDDEWVDWHDPDTGIDDPREFLGM